MNDNNLFLQTKPISSCPSPDSCKEQFRILLMTVKTLKCYCQDSSIFQKQKTETVFSAVNLSFTFGVLSKECALSSKDSQQVNIV